MRGRVPRRAGTNARPSVQPPQRHALERKRAEPYVQHGSDAGDGEENQPALSPRYGRAVQVESFETRV